MLIANPFSSLNLTLAHQSHIGQMGKVMLVLDDLYLGIEEASFIVNATALNAKSTHSHSLVDSA